MSTGGISIGGISGYGLVTPTSSCTRERWLRVTGQNNNVKISRHFIQLSIRLDKTRLAFCLDMAFLRVGEG